ncbi:MAG: glutaredoxin [Spirochaetota bacterium]
MSPQVTIYSKDYCPYCVRAKEFFAKKQINFHEIDVEKDPAAYEELKRKTNHMTVPQIFIGDKFIGGYTDLVAKFQRGEIVL